MRRRDFVVKSAFAASYLSTVPGILHGARLRKGEETLRLGIIGTGNRGTGIMKMIQDVESITVTACCDVLPFRLDKASTLAPAANIYNDYRKLLEDAHVDAVVVAVPFGLHEQVVIDALDAEKHVYCEKTMAKGYDGIDRVVKAANSSRKIFQTGHQYHSSRLYTHVVSEIHQGLLGEITAIQCQWNRNSNWRRPVPDSKWERLINWRMYREYSGGLVAELCSHQIDFSNWVLGEEPYKVMGTGGIDYWKDGRETYDNIHLITEYPGGVKATYMCTTTNSYDNYQIKVLGKKGTVILTTEEAWFTPEPATSMKAYANVDGVSGATAWDGNTKKYPFHITHLNPTKQALLDFRESVVSGDQPASDVRTGAKTAVVVQMALDAMMENKIIYQN